MNNHRNRNGNGTAAAVHTNGARPRTTERTQTPVSVEALSWDALPPVVTEALAQPLDPTLVSQRRGRGGRRLDYLEGHTAIDQANRIFGYGGWGYELVGEARLCEVELAASNRDERAWAYSAVVRVTVPGAPSRTDVGFHPVTDQSIEGHETAYKGAVTDALKRALRSFGPQFGNGLYGGAGASQSAQPTSPKRESRPPARRRVEPQANHAESNDEPDARHLRAQLLELGLAQGFSEEQLREAVRQKTGLELDQLEPNELVPLVASAAERLEHRRESSNG